MRYIRTKDDRIIPAGTATHELTQGICDAGYFKTLNKGSYVTIGEEWTNFYGRWVDIIDENGSHYSVRPNKVKEVTRELPQADTIKDLCDEFVIKYKSESKPRIQDLKELVNCLSEQNLTLSYHIKWLKNSYKDELEFIKLGIWTDQGLTYVADTDEKGELELL